MQESAIYQEIYRAGELRGRQEGKLEGKLEVALNLLRRGIATNEVVEITGLSQDLVESLARNQQTN